MAELALEKSTYLDDGLKFLEEKNYDFAYQNLKQARQENPDDLNLYNPFMQTLWCLKKYQELREICDYALELDKTFASTCSYLGNLFWNDQNFDQATEYYQKAIKYDSQYAPAYNGLGIIYAEQKKHEQAITYYQKAIASDPQYVQAHCNLGFIYQRKKSYEQAIACYQEAIKCDINFINSYLGLGMIFILKQDETLARQALKKAYEIFSQNKGYDLSYILIIMLYIANEQTACREMVNEYLDHAPLEDRSFQLITGISYICNENFEEGEDYFINCLSGNSDDALYYCFLGEIHLKAGNIKDAEKYFSRAKKSDPTFEVLSFSKILPQIAFNELMQHTPSMVSYSNEVNGTCSIEGINLIKEFAE